LVEFIIGAFLYAKLKNKYNIKYIFKTWEIYPPMLFALFYIFLEGTMFFRWHYFIPYAHLIKTATLLSYIPLILKYKLYQDDNGKLITSPMVKAGFCLWLGSELNKIAMYFNNGYMPTFIDLGFWVGYVKSDGFIDGLHILGNSYSHAIPLCNIFDWGYTCVSIGDLLIRFYAFIILFYAIKYSNKTL
jgi:hypothetical protein